MSVCGDDSLSPSSKAPMVIYLDNLGKGVHTSILRMWDTQFKLKLMFKDESITIVCLLEWGLTGLR